MRGEETNNKTKWTILFNGSLKKQKSDSKYFVCHSIIFFFFSFPGLDVDMFLMFIDVSKELYIHVL